MTVNFNNFFEFLREKAEEKGLKRGEWMQKSGLNRTRYSEFSRACGLTAETGEIKKRNLTSDYFMKLLRGLNMSERRVQKESGIKFSKEQRKELGFQSFVKANSDWIRKLYDNPAVFEACKTVADIAQTKRK